MLQSTKALYLLGFNGLLGILISGSLMYLVEKGEWDWQTRTYNRYVGRSWNQTSMEWDDVTAESPFLSIPHSFWWAVVTSTTVGFGDVFPTTTWGYVIATATMVFSLIIAALPIGVIGGNFTQVWDEYAQEKKREVAQTVKDRKFITSAIQRIDPFEMSRLMYVEVWNERFPDERSFAAGGRSRSARPQVHEFVGQANVFLEFDPENSTRNTKTLKLEHGAEGVLPKRDITGTITVGYEWTPAKGGGPPPPGINGESPQSLQGQLKVTVMHAEGLAKLTYSKDGKSRGGCNPYCRVFCYPNSPTEKVPLCPSAWRSPLDADTVSPKWNAVHTFEFNWVPPKPVEDAPEGPPGSPRGLELGTGRSDGTFAGPPLTKKGQVYSLVQILDRELMLLRAELRALQNRITRFSLTPEPPAEP